jgi:hypothetical protein
LRLSRNLAVEARMIIAVKWLEPELLRTLIVALVVFYHHTVAQQKTSGAWSYSSFSIR